MEAVPANCLEDVRPLALKACVIGIDEGQFAFGNILSLVPLAESVVKLHAVCMQCFKEAAYTKRIGAEKEVEVIGGADKYQAVCRKCYGGLVDKENSAPFREETPQQALTVKLLEAGVPRKLFSNLHL
uniref:Thymidine kinase n=1 Tax=Knipowitschia caucasica TaxID=637954 RepID=A0AAV2LL97_KNICA